MAHDMRNNSTALDALKEKVNALPAEKKLQASKTITPDAAQNTVYPDNGYDGFEQVIVNAMPVGALDTPGISVSTSGLITATVKVATAGYLPTSAARSGTKQLATQAAKTITPTKSSQTAVAKDRYTTGAVTVAAIPSQYNDTSDSDAMPPHVVYGYSAYSKYGKINGQLGTDKVIVAPPDIEHSAVSSCLIPTIYPVMDYENNRQRIQIDVSNLGDALKENVLQGKKFTSAAEGSFMSRKNSALYRRSPRNISLLSMNSPRACASSSAAAPVRMAKPGVS